MEDKFFVLVTAIIKSNDRVLITQRSKTKNKWPSKWTVPGGHLSTIDFLGKPTAINNQWYNTLSNAVRREVKEEVNLEIDNIKYLCDIAVPECIIISFTADLVGNDIPTIQLDEVEQYAWVKLPEISKYDLIDGLEEEIRKAYN